MQDLITFVVRKGYMFKTYVTGHSRKHFGIRQVLHFFWQIQYIKNTLSRRQCSLYIACNTGNPLDGVGNIDSIGQKSYQRAWRRFPVNDVVTTVP